MNEVVTTNSAEFQRVWNLWLRNTKDELAKAINRRLFFLLARCYVLAPPASPATERAKIKAYMNEGVSGVTHLQAVQKRKRIDGVMQTVRVYKHKSGSVLTRKNLIEQARRARQGLKGLYGADMRKESGKMASFAGNSVGYLKSGFARAIRKISGSFVTFGKVDKTGKVIRNPNAALVRFAQDYGAGHSPADNTSIHRGAQANCYPAISGWNPMAYGNMSYKFADPGSKGRPSNVSDYESSGRQILEQVVNRAFSDEYAEMKAHLDEVMTYTADQACLSSPDGRAS